MAEENEIDEEIIPVIEGNEIDAIEKIGFPHSRIRAIIEYNGWNLELTDQLGDLEGDDRLEAYILAFQEENKVYPLSVPGLLDYLAEAINYWD